MTPSRRNILILFVAYLAGLLVLAIPAKAPGTSDEMAPFLIAGGLGTMIFLAALIPRQLTRQHIWVLFAVFGFLVLLVYLMRRSAAPY